MVEFAYTAAVLAIPSALHRLRETTHTHDRDFPAGCFSDGCRGKACYPSRRVARGRLRSLGRIWDIRRMSAYRCKACHRFHIGHTPAAVAMAARTAEAIA